jgi:type VI protein secretion system component Hcp
MKGTMQRTTKTSAKFTKLVEKTHQLKEELLNSNHYELINDIDARTNVLFDIYLNGKTLKQEVNKKIINMGKQNHYLKYHMYIKPKKVKSK